jgi:hypothetical protein
MSYIDKISDSCDRTDNLELIDMYFIGNYQNKSHVGPSWTFGIGFAISQYMQYEFI